MWNGFALFPDQASTMAEGVDSLSLFLLAAGGVFLVLIFGLTFLFAVIYRRRSEDELPGEARVPTALVVVWSFLPFLLVMLMFGWGASLYLKSSTPPEGGMEIDVVGKQWVWRVQHPEGRQEINELHVPYGHPVRLRMTSQDVVHSFSIPAFRLKKDVLPGRYTTAWFEATRAGEYHLFCAEYCGARHSEMRGKVVVMDPRAYEQWASGEVPGETPVALGQRLFAELKCDTCHRADGAGRGPSLARLLGRTVTLRDGRTLIADEAYVRESILNPKAKLVTGYEPVMPTFEGQLSESQLLGIIAYLTTLEDGGQP